MINPVTRAALALRERRRAPDMAQIMSALPVPVVLLDADNRFRFVNHAAEQFLGISVSGLSQLRLRDIVPEDNPLFLLVEQVRRSGATVSDHDMSVDSPRLNKRGMTVQGASLPEEPGSVVLVLQDASAATCCASTSSGLSGIRTASRSPSRTALSSATHSISSSRVIAMRMPFEMPPL